MTPKQNQKLSACLAELGDKVRNVPSDTRISGIATDSRKVQPGDVFFALTGDNVDGHNYIPQALEQGAAAVVGARPSLDLAVPYVQIKGDDREALAQFSAAFYGYPSRKLVVIGVTGTDGKTTTTNLVYEILKSAGVAVGMISTVNAEIGDETLDTGFHVTTPEAPDIQRYLARMVAAGLTHAVLETTSHGLAQKRVAAVDYNLAAVTNVTHEHLDYHRTYRGYLEAKGLLFSALSAADSPGRRVPPLDVAPLAVLNRDDESYAYLSEISPANQLSYSLSSEADLWADEIENTPSELRFTVHGPGKSFRIRTPLIGRYNVHNGLAALGLTVFGLNVPVEAAQKAFANIPTVPGRMESLDLGQEFMAIVDFAHTPNAIRQALRTARELTRGKLIAVFGSAGLRDVEKRKMMPEIAVGIADEVILTAEDPRTESLAGILEDMAEGAQKGGGVEGETFWREPDRGTAIRRAVARAKSGDLVILCGKGHEQSMCFGQIEYAWDDRTALRAALGDLLGIPGPEMPALPTEPKRN